MVDKDNDGSRLMKAVEAVAITPAAARAITERYEGQIRAGAGKLTDREVTDLVIKKIISRYSKMASMVGGTSALAGVIPGVGTAAAVVGGGAVDVAACTKLQIDMTMCLCVAINREMTDEDAKHMSYVIALSGSIEGLAKSSGAPAASKAAVKVVENTLKGPALETVKALFKTIGITFTRKAFVKALPFGIGVVVGSSVNYGLTLFVGRVARDVLWADYTKRSEASLTPTSTEIAEPEERLAAAD
ncbi:hypothetical protein [Acidocella sp.]|uniref:hypothetical protein n=1 Tax=Acidocella sp. TaxID=50710 RepID=UPI003D04B778